jgi:hypothetical protein
VELAELCEQKLMRFVFADAEVQQAPYARLIGRSRPGCAATPSCAARESPR